MIKQKKQHLLFLLMLFFSYVQAQESLTLSLQEARSYALEHNKVLQNAKTDLEISRKQVWATISQGLPQVDGTLDYTDFFNYEMEFSFGGGGGNDMYQIDFSKLDEGDFEILQLLSSMTDRGDSKIKMKNSSSAKIQVSQLIFSGQYIVGVQMAKIARAISEYSLSMSQNDIIEAVTSSYYMVLLTQENKNILESNIENLISTQQQTEVMVAAGVAEQIDLDQLDVAVMMLENTKSQLERATLMGMNLLRFQLGVDANTNIVLSDKLQSIVEGIDMSLLSERPFEMEQNPLFNIMKKQEQIAKKGLQLERTSYLPVLVGFYSYNEKILKTDFDMNPNHIAGLSLQVPIFSSGMRYAKVQQKKLEFVKAQNNRSMIEDQLKLEEKQYRFDLINAIDQYNLQKKSVDVAQRVYENTNLKYQQGMVSSMQLSQASDNLLKAKNNYMSATMSLLQAKLSFEKLLNKLQ